MIAVLLVAMMLVPAPAAAEQIDVQAAERAGKELLAAIAANQQAIARVMELLEEEQELKRQRYHTRKGRGAEPGDAPTTSTTMLEGEE
jgi:hypothetical protein